MPILGQFDESWPTRNRCTHTAAKQLHGYESACVLRQVINAEQKEREMLMRWCRHSIEWLVGSLSQRYTVSLSIRP